MGLWVTVQVEIPRDELIQDDAQTSQTNMCGRILLAYPGRAHMGAICNRLAACSGHSLKQATLMLKATAETSFRAQDSLFRRVGQYLLDLAESGAMSLMFFLHHVSYDETKMRLRVAWPSFSGKVSEDSKTFVVNHSFAFLVKLAVPQPSPHTVPGASAEHLLIRFSTSASMRGSDSTAGESVASVLKSMWDTPTDISSAFKRSLRLIESDEAPSNSRGERLLRAHRSKDVPLMQRFCNLHKVHAACERTLECVDPAVLSGITRTLLAAQSSQTLSLLSQKLPLLISRRLVVEPLATELSSSAKRYRANALAMVPPGKCTRRMCLIAVIAGGLLNGDWQRKCYHSPLQKRLLPKQAPHRAKVAILDAPLVSLCPTISLE